jgi:hypothetical protein
VRVGLSARKQIVQVRLRRPTVNCDSDVERVPDDVINGYP